MSKDKDLVEKISRLSRLKIDENEIEGFIKNFKDILNYIAVSYTHLTLPTKA